LVQLNPGLHSEVALHSEPSPKIPPGVPPVTGTVQAPLVQLNPGLHSEVAVHFSPSAKIPGCVHTEFAQRSPNLQSESTLHSSPSGTVPTGATLHTALMHLNPIMQSESEPHLVPCFDVPFVAPIPLRKDMPLKLTLAVQSPSSALIRSLFTNSIVFEKVTIVFPSR
jgi:hypothetical protein